MTWLSNLASILSPTLSPIFPLRLLRLIQASDKMNRREELEDVRAEKNVSQCIGVKLIILFPATEPSRKKARDDSTEPSVSSNKIKFKSRRLKCITETCKVCAFPMDQRSFMPEKETFYCSTECIHKKVKQVRKVGF
jgi:hypothetical protein